MRGSKIGADKNIIKFIDITFYANMNSHNTPWGHTQTMFTARVGGCVHNCQPMSARVTWWVQLMSMFTR